MNDRKTCSGYWTALTPKYLINPDRAWVASLGGDAAIFVEKNCNEFLIADNTQMVPGVGWADTGDAGRAIWFTPMTKMSGLVINNIGRDCLVFATKIITYGRYWTPQWSGYKTMNVVYQYNNYGGAAGTCPSLIGLTSDALLQAGGRRTYGR
ncbi:hypothetical protein HDU76_006438 [Blyttiomyces sp. JEL0837]|nr:hypothetical protein HDU76_006438 [Blyttiomyces sp. JEL0837]